MAGYASQADYEADLLSTYLRRGRVSPIARRDVDLALSIYKLPARGTAYAKQKPLKYSVAKKYGKGKNDAQLMSLATQAVLNKSTADRAATAKAKAASAASTSMARATAASIAPTATIPQVPKAAPAASPTTLTAPRPSALGGPLSLTSRSRLTPPKPRRPSSYTLR